LVNHEDIKLQEKEGGESENIDEDDDKKIDHNSPEKD
jgi:hypothetical protein